MSVENYTECIRELTATIWENNRLIKEKKELIALLSECRDGIEDMINSGEILQEPMMHELLAKLAPFQRKK